jgi:hypothetical protein
LFTTGTKGLHKYIIEYQEKESGREGGLAFLIFV